MICNVSLQVIPNVTEEDLYPVVDKVIDMIGMSGVKYIVGPMETTMEGDLRQLLELVARAQEICFANGASRIISVVKIDYKAGGVSIDEKIENYR
ncbi:MAG: thiamine-binding protein [Desulfotomaculaceae bacterium]|nr:thiamine-binding protein [Desulfotomaculaceae bacterium]